VTILQAKYFSLHFCNYCPVLFMVEVWLITWLGRIFADKIHTLASLPWNQDFAKGLPIIRSTIISATKVAKIATCMFISNQYISEEISAELILNKIYSESPLLHFIMYVDSFTINLLHHSNNSKKCVNTWSIRLVIVCYRFILGKVFGYCSRVLICKHWYTYVHTSLKSYHIGIR